MTEEKTSKALLQKELEQLQANLLLEKQKVDTAEQRAKNAEQMAQKTEAKLSQANVMKTRLKVRLEKANRTFEEANIKIEGLEKLIAASQKRNGELKAKDFYSGFNHAAKQVREEISVKLENKDAEVAAFLFLYHQYYELHLSSSFIIIIVSIIMIIIIISIMLTPPPHHYHTTMIIITFIIAVIMI